MLLTIVAGARPNFMKIAPIIKAIHLLNKEKQRVEYRLIHTGQHYDKKMSGDFFDELGIPQPHANLGAGGGTQAEQTSAIMIGFERELKNNRPKVVLVVGDVTSTMACTITAKKLGVQVVHVEAGIRSGDMTMPEEINRMVTDAICDHFFTTSRLANKNLRDAGISEDKIHFVGNTMIDTLYQNLEKVRAPEIYIQEKIKENAYYLLTLHRPSNVDNPKTLKDMLQTILENSKPYSILFPVHPRTKKALESIAFKNKRLLQIGPMPYLEFIYLIKNARGVITDSGGITEETTVLGVPCMTLRGSTERPETINVGTNVLAGNNPVKIPAYLKKMNRGEWKKGQIPELWDGNAASRIIMKLVAIYS